MAQQAQASGSPDKIVTVVWGERLERARFLKVPKILFYLGRFDDRMGDTVQPRHVLLLLALAARKFGEAPVRVFWKELATSLGVRVGSVRKWGYELRDMGLLRIENLLRERAAGDERTPGNDRNAFDIAPFVSLLQQADATWRLKRINSAEKLR